MNTKRYTEEQLIGTIKQHESSVKVDDICRQLNISNCTFYSWHESTHYDGISLRIYPSCENVC